MSPTGRVAGRRWPLASRDVPENLSCHAASNRSHQISWLPQWDMTGGPTPCWLTARARRVPEDAFR